MKLYQTLLNLLQNSGIPFQEWGWDQRPNYDYGMIALDGAGDVQKADNRIENQAPEGSIDLYTYENDREKMHTIQSILNDLDGCAWYLSSVQYEAETRLIHWEWIFQLEQM